MSARVLLFGAYFIGLDPHEQEIMAPFAPLGPRYVAAWLRRAGWDADFWDSTFAPGAEVWPSVLDREQPAVVGLYAHTVTRPTGLKMVAEARRRGIAIIAGGPDAGSGAETYLRGGVDVVVIGEGEQTCQELLEVWTRSGRRWDPDTLRTVEGIAFLDGDVVVRTRPRALIRELDDIPWPLRSEERHRPYRQAWEQHHGHSAISMATTRGCPYPCTWCSKATFGDSLRRRSVGSVLEEFTHLHRRFAPGQVWFVDDTFTIRRRWVMEFCRAVVERGLVQPWYCIGRVDAVDRELLRWMKRAGCTRIYVSAESGSQRVLDAMKKGFKVEQILRAGELMREQGIELGVFTMLGYPGEELVDVEATAEMLSRLQPAVALVSLAHPIAGTAFHSDVQHLITGERDGGRLSWKLGHDAEWYRRAERLLLARRELAGLLAGRAWGPRALRLALEVPLRRWQLRRAGPRQLSAVG